MRVSNLQSILAYVFHEVVKGCAVQRLQKKKKNSIWT